MNEPTCPPRSALYALPPIAVGTTNVESLTSYFCRLAVAHSVTSTDLLHRISKTCGWAAPAKNFWKDTNLSGMGDVVERYACALSEMTSVERLDLLTLLPWRNVIAQRSRAPVKGRWCAACFKEDLVQGRVPYFRLAWDVGDIDVCLKDGIQLMDECPDCGCTRARNNATCVVPGWCCHCGTFLGGVREMPTSAIPAQTWKAAQVGQLLATQASLSSSPDRDNMIERVRKLVEQFDGGMSAKFARRIGLNKSTVHGWLKQGGVPTLAAHLRIASQTGVSLEALLTGAIGGGVTGLHEYPSLADLFPNCEKRALPVHHDTAEIEAMIDALRQSDAAVTVSEAARRMKVRRRQLYRVENEKARLIGTGWEEHRRARSEQHRLEAVRVIEAAVGEIFSRGKTPNLREVQQLVPRELLGSVRGVITMIQEAARKIEDSRSATLP